MLKLSNNTNRNMKESFKNANTFDVEVNLYRLTSTYAKEGKVIASYNLSTYSAQDIADAIRRDMKEFNMSNKTQYIAPDIFKRLEFFATEDALNNSEGDILFYEEDDDGLCYCLGFSPTNNIWIKPNYDVVFKVFVSHDEETWIGGSLYDDGVSVDIDDVWISLNDFGDYDAQLQSDVPKYIQEELVSVVRDLVLSKF